LIFVLILDPVGAKIEFSFRNTKEKL